MADAEATSTMTLAVHAVDAAAMVAVSAFVLHLTMFSGAPGSLGEGRGGRTPSKNCTRNVSCVVPS